ncbi:MULTISPECIES: hypothetical protein [unclassified Inquilinus]|uniref:hypothetical protein n=1 Tax=unclassified Inquilinus TaxID=2645927 RepID=UPI003F8E07DB
MLTFLHLALHRIADREIQVPALPVRPGAEPKRPPAPGLAKPARRPAKLRVVEAPQPL